MSDETPTTTNIDEELAGHVQRAFEFDRPPESYEEFWERMMATYSEALDRGVTVEDLCTTDESPHRATVDGETHHYQCVTDAFVLGAYLDRPVTARTVSAVSGEELVVEFDADGVSEAPDDAWLSVGAERSVEAPERPVTPGKMYGRFCPYSKAFASREEYEEWAADHPEAVTDAQPLDRSLALQARLLGDADGEGFGGESDRTGGERDGGCRC